MDCPPDNTLVALADGRLPRAEVEAIEEHARACSRCPGRIEMARAAASGGQTATFANVAGLEVRPRAGPEGDRAAARRGAPDPELLERGASVGRYTILALVGRGGMGEVYAAYDPELDRKIALKLLRARRRRVRLRRSELRARRSLRAILRSSSGS